MAQEDFVPGRPARFTLHGIQNDLYRRFREQQEQQLRVMLKQGVPIDRIEFVTLAGCQCKGAGAYVESEVLAKGTVEHISIRIRTCPDCPGYRLIAGPGGDAQQATRGGDPAPQRSSDAGQP